MSPAPVFPGLVDAAFDLRWTIDPVAATAAGLTRHDERLGAYGEEHVRQYLAALKAETGALEWCEPATLADEVDRTALLSDTRVLLHQFERERPHVRNPAFWLSHLFEGLYLLLAARDRSREHRVRTLAARLAETPRFLTLARATLTDCPAVFVESGIRIGDGGAALLEQIGNEFGEHGDPAFAGALRGAREALDDFLRCLRDTLLPAASADFAVGEEAFNFRLHHQHALRQTAPQLLHYGHALIGETEAALTRLADAMQPGAAWPDVVDRLRADHPGPDGLVGAYAEAMERARRFVEQHGVAPIPEGPLEVVATPPFLRPLTPFAAYQPPGAYSEDRTGWFYVTSPDHRAPEHQERALRDHCVHGLAATALHEGYPGHHLQFLHAVTQPRPVRKVIGSPVSIEGWALYCEDMMAELGFYPTLEQQLFQKLALLWRAVRIVVDVGLHTRGMSFEQAVQFLTARVHSDRALAEAEVRRYCAAPCYQLAYAVGRRELLALRDAYRDAAGGDFSLRRFHEDVLAYGGLPVSLMRWGMGLGE